MNEWAGDLPPLSNDIAVIEAGDFLPPSRTEPFPPASAKQWEGDMPALEVLPLLFILPIFI